MRVMMGVRVMLLKLAPAGSGCGSVAVAAVDFARGGQALGPWARMVVVVGVFPPMRVSLVRL